MADRVLYLNRDKNAPMFNRLHKVIAESKQGRASASQWASIIKALPTKGIKSQEIDESKIVPWLDAEEPGSVITREVLLAKIESLAFTVKEVLLGSPRFGGVRQKGGTYQEFLYIANSERANVVDELEAVEYEMNELVFCPEVFEEDPELPLRLERRRTQLISMKSVAIDFSHHHFSQDAGRHGKNLLAHARVTVRPEEKLYFLEEIQSDWAQQGRKNQWKTIPEGPLVTNTESWAGMVLRRHFSLAALDPQIETIAWITESMRNGGKQNLDNEKAKLNQKAVYDKALKEGIEDELKKVHVELLPPDGVDAAKKLAKTSVEKALATKGISEPYDMLNDFYLKVIPKIVDKILAGTNEKVQLRSIMLNGLPVTVPTVVITDKVREKLKEQQPIYSRGNLLSGPVPLIDSVLLSMTQSAAKYLGSAKHLRLVNHLYDISTGNKVAGRYVNSLAQVSLHADNIEEVLDHECFHFAQDNLFTQSENAVLRQEFATNSPLNLKVREILTRRGDFALAKDCINPDECSAQAFALWNKKVLDVDDVPKVNGLFSDLVQSIRDVVRWVKSEVLQQKNQSVSEIFTEFWAGNIAKRESERAQSLRQYDSQLVSPDSQRSGQKEGVAG